ncbi:MAG: hypothetical protein R3E83_12410 [Burkholderiaceae bacterium]
MPDSPKPPVVDDEGRTQPPAPVPSGSLSPAVDAFIDLRGRQSGSGVGRTPPAVQPNPSAPPAPTASPLRAEPVRRQSSQPAGAPLADPTYIN